MANNIKTLNIINDDQIVDNAFNYEQIIVNKDIGKFTIKTRRTNPSVAYNIPIITNRINVECVLTLIDSFDESTIYNLKDGEQLNIYVFDDGRVQVTTTPVFQKFSQIVLGSGGNNKNPNLGSISIGNSDCGAVVESSIGTNTICIGSLAGRNSELGDNCIAIGSSAMAN